MPVPRITREDLKVKLENPDPAARPVVFDVRLKYPYEHSTMTLPGAVRPPEGMAEVAKDRDIVAYDSDPDELVSSEFAAGLIKAGYREVGRFKRHVLFKGRYIDSILVEKCRDETTPA